MIRCWRCTRAGTSTTAVAASELAIGDMLPHYGRVTDIVVAADGHIRVELGAWDQLLLRPGKRVRVTR